MGDTKPNRWRIARILRKSAVDWRQAWAKPEPGVTIAMTPLEAMLFARRTGRTEQDEGPLASVN